MNFSIRLWIRRMAARRLVGVGAVLWGLLAPAVLRAGYAGPVAAPTDPFGAPGPHAVVAETFPSPGWPGQVVTVFRPDGAAGRWPTWFFAHGFGGANPAYYGELLHHLASHGAVVVFSPYPANLLRVEENYSMLYDGFIEAAARFADRIDTRRVGFAGHSYGGGAVPAMALRALRERGWGADGLALLMLAPWYSHFVSDADLASFPAGTQAVVQIYEDDLVNDHRMAIDVFSRLNLPAEEKDFLIVRSDRIDGYNYQAAHLVPTGENAPRDGAAFNALDAWAVHRIAQALAASVFADDPAGRAVALGNGSAEQTQMGAAPGGRALRRMVATDSPVPLFPSTRYVQAFDSALNPRRTAALPAPVVRPRLANLSARARSGGGDDVLIAGAAVGGSRPKSLLIRAVGPALANRGIEDPMADPRLVVFRGAVMDLALDDWGDTPDPGALNAATTETGAAVLTPDSKDAAMLASFSPGVLTMHAVPTDGVAGVALVELFDADGDGSARLENLSARARVDAGEGVLIAGFVLDGGGDGQVLIRGVGPALGGLGVPKPLRDPVLEVFRGSERLAANDNWSAEPSQAAEMTAAANRVGAFPLPIGSADASVLLALPAGVYTAHLRAADQGSGIGLVEIYLVP